MSKYSHHKRFGPTGRGLPVSSQPLLKVIGEIPKRGKGRWMLHTYLAKLTRLREMGLEPLSEFSESDGREGRAVGGAVTKRRPYFKPFDNLVTHGLRIPVCQASRHDLGECLISRTIEGQQSRGEDILKGCQALLAVDNVIVFNAYKPFTRLRFKYHRAQKVGRAFSIQ